MPSVPSLPTTAPTQVEAGRDAGRRAELARTLAVGQHELERRARGCVVVPYFSVCGPPEFSATLPPIVHASWLEGSGA